MSMERPNIVLIMTDQHALHAVGAYGAPVCRTPHIDSLAEDGIRLTRAYTPVCLCTPARASLLTGVYPHNHGAVYNTGCHLPMTEDRYAEDLEIYPDALREAGYRTGYFGKWHAGIRKTAADAGFEGFGPRGYSNAYASETYTAYRERNDIPRPTPCIEWSALGDLSGGMGSGYLSGQKEGHSGFYVAQETTRLIDEFSGGDSPWFVTANFWGPHAPYLPTEDCKDMYDPASIEEWASYRDDLSAKPFIHKKYRDYICSHSRDTSWDEWAVIISRYYAQTTIIDEAIGKILAHLKACDLYDSTMIIFAADHGETAGIHGGMFDKGSMAYEELYHVPLIVKRPANEGAGQTRDQLVSLLDLTPTLCETAGTSMTRSDGESLLPILADPTHPWRDTLVSEYYGHRMVAGLRIAWHENTKYVHNLADRDELYDIEKDPAEMNNLIDDSRYDPVIKDMRRRMLEEMEKSGDTLGPQAFRFLKNDFIR